MAIWKQRLERWYIVRGADDSEDKEKGEEKNLKKVIAKLTPRQFQDALENGQYSFSW